jgi:cysteine synthase
MGSNDSILCGIGNTPLLNFGGVLVKCEFLNPSGSIKDRLAKYMIERAESEGVIKPGDTIVEATSGNTGNAMSMVAAARGYKMIVVMPSDFSEERITISKAFGAEVRLVGDFNVGDALSEAIKLGEKDGYWCPRQFDNEWNVEENEIILGKEIIGQIPEGIKIDAILQGVGTGGTLIGVSMALKKYHNENLRVFAMEPSEAALIKCGNFCKHLIEGVSDGFVPGIIKRHRDEIDEIICIDSESAVKEMKNIAFRFGIFVGPSSGANWLATSKIKALYPEIKNILTFFCDEGEKYLYKYYGKKN